MTWNHDIGFPLPRAERIVTLSKIDGFEMVKAL
jgi:hypothetical protein